RRACGRGWVGRDHPRIRRIRGLGQRRRGARRLCASREHRGRSRGASGWRGRRDRESSRCARRVRRRRVGRPLHHRQRLQGDARRELAPTGDRGRRGRVPRDVRGGARMTVTVRLAAPLRAAAGGNTTIDFDVTDLPELASEIADRYPELAARVLRDGTFGRFVNVFIDGEDARFLAESDLRGKRTVEILPAMSAGALQAIDLACRVYLRAGDVVVAESPAFANALSAFRNHGARVLEVPVDGEGLDVAEAARRIRKLGIRPRMFFVVPNFQNPTGETLSFERREALLALAASHGAVVVEDDPYAALRYRGDDLPPLAALGGAEIVSIGTFSKTFLPGLRVGWVIAHTDVI